VKSNSAAHPFPLSQAEAHRKSQELVDLLMEQYGYTRVEAEAFLSALRTEREAH
jgi:hypothetical protein